MTRELRVGLIIPNEDGEALELLCPGCQKTITTGHFGILVFENDCAEWVVLDELVSCCDLVIAVPLAFGTSEEAQDTIEFIVKQPRLNVAPLNYFG